MGIDLVYLPIKKLFGTPQIAGNKEDVLDLFRSS